MNQTNSRRWLIIGSILIVAAIVGWSLYALDKANDRTPENNAVTSKTKTQSDPADKTAPTASERVTITVTDNGFEPRDITVERGTVVIIKNESSHDVQFSSDDHPTHRMNSEMNLNTLLSGESTSYTAAEVGEWGYHDHLNDDWTGTITVKEQG